MMEHLDQEFNEALAGAPPLPDGIYRAIRAHARHRSAIRASVFAMAASLLLVLGGFQAYRSFAPAPAVSQDVADELQHAGEYLNGTTVESELPLYVSLEDK